ncbi:unannotated protein [freshwater metagenome]|uniref:Unannotated protein n=1 Tax=freshwater metagenome TaxID=449393 RepID=A0A6J7KE89_9ZZZZ
MRDAITQVAALAGECDSTGLVGVEARPKGDEAAHRVRTLVDEHFDRIGIAQPRTSDQRVELMFGG